MDFLSYVVLQDCYPILDALLRYLPPRDIVSLMDAVGCRKYPSVAIRELNPLLHLGYPRPHVDAIMSMSRSVLLLGAGVGALWDEYRSCPNDHNFEFPCYDYQRSGAAHSDICQVYLLFIPRDVDAAVEWLRTVNAHILEHMWCCHDRDDALDCDDITLEMSTLHQFDEMYPGMPMVKMSYYSDYHYGYNCSIHYGVSSEEWCVMYASESTESSQAGFRYMDLKRDPLVLQTATNSPLNVANSIMSIKVDTGCHDAAYIHISLC